MRPRFVRPAHESPGRVRFRLSWLHDQPDEADAIAEQLAALPGIEEVRVRAYTGSVLCLYDPLRLDAERITGALLQATGVDKLTPHGEETPEELRAIVGEAVREGSELSRAMAEAGRGLHLDFLTLTEGRAGLGTASTLFFWLAALGRAAASDELPLPHWYELIYWGFRSFGALEGEALEQGSAKLASHGGVEKGDLHG